MNLLTESQNALGIWQKFVFGTLSNGFKSNELSFFQQVIQFRDDLFVFMPPFRT